MQKALFLIIILFIFTTCKKEGINEVKPKTTQLYPLVEGSKWIYIDSFFDYDGTPYGFDTFYLKPAKEIIRNNIVYTPITDQWEDSIFKIRSDDSSAFILEPLSESLLFRLPVPANQFYIDSSSAGDALSSIIFTNKITTTTFPSYKIIITQDDGYWPHYKQQELYFSPNIGIVKGFTRYKNRYGNIYTSDSFVLLAYID